MKKVITRESVVELILKGYHRDQIAEHLNCFKGTVTQLIKRYNITEPVTRKRYRDQLDENQIRELYINKQFTVVDVAAKLQVNVATLRKKLLAMGIKPRNRAETCRLLNYKHIGISEDELLNLYSKMTVEKIVQFLHENNYVDVCDTTLYTRLKNIEIKRGIKIIKPNICGKSSN